MNIASKRLKYKQIWELVMIDGELNFLVKDVMKYFGLSDSSQGTIRASVNDRDIKMISGPEVRNMKHVTSRAMVINRNGLIDFIHGKSKRFDRLEKGLELNQHVGEIFVPAMIDVWNRKFPKDAQPKEREKNLFDLTLEQEFEKMKEQLQQMGERLEELEKKAQGDPDDVVIEKGDKQFIEVDKIVDLLRGAKP